MFLPQSYILLQLLKEPMSTDTIWIYNTKSLANY